MKKKIHLSIPEPCHEDWKNMTPQQKGRFCGSCQKTVVDFSNMSDSEVLNYFTKARGRVCGRFGEKQINRSYAELPPISTTNWLKAGVFASGLLVTSIVQGQQGTEIGKVVIEKPMEQKIGEIRSDIVETKEKIVLKGQVNDEEVERDGLIGASVRVVGTDIHTSSDIDGSFQLEIPIEVLQQETWTIEVSYTGYESQSRVFQTKYLPTETVMFTLAANNFYKELANESRIYEEPMVAGMVFYIEEVVVEKKTSFWQNTKQWMRGLKEEMEQKREETLAETEENTLTEEKVNIPVILSPSADQLDDGISVFPNPFAEKLVLKYDSDREQKVELSIVDESGKVLFKQKKTVVKGENLIELAPQIPMGNYWLHLNNGTDKPLIQSIVHLARA